MKIFPIKPPYYAIDTPFSRRFVAVCKETPGMNWDPKKRHWFGYKDAVDDVCRKLDLPQLPEAGKSSYTSFFDDGLREYQKEATVFLCRQAAEGCILADDMGLGKTLVGIRFLQSVTDNPPPAVVVCPAFVKGVWEAELQKWWPECQYAVISGKGGFELPPADVYVVNYEVLSSWVDWLNHCRVVVFDEAHYLQNERSSRSKASAILAGHCDYRVAMTGTPMTNRPKDLWNVVQTVSPGRFGTFFAYAKQFANAFQKEISIFGDSGPRIVWDFDGKSNLEELNRRLKYFMLRRTKDEVMLELPAKTRQVIRLEAPKNLPVFDLEIAKNKNSFRKMLDAAADLKFPDVLELIGNHVEAGRRVVVFTYRKAVAGAITHELTLGGVEAAFITGDVIIEKRREIIASQPQVLVATIDSCGVGISLADWDTAVFAEMSWEPQKLLQAESRLHRFGQAKNVLIQYVVVSGSGEEFLVDKVVDKLDGIEAAIGGVEKLGEDLVEPEGDAFQRLFEALV